MDRRPVLTLAALLADAATPRPSAQIIPAYTLPTLRARFMQIILKADPEVPTLELFAWATDMEDALTATIDEPLPRWLAGAHTELIRKHLGIAADQALEDLQ